jgi:hypothetical protein
VRYHPVTEAAFIISSTSLACKSGGVAVNWSQRKLAFLSTYYVTYVFILLIKHVYVLVFRVVFWVILPCKMIVARRFRGAYCPHP